MLNGMLGRKVGMTQIFEENGRVTPVTVVQVGPVTVVQKKTVDTDGYDSVQVGFEEIEERKVNRPIKGHFKGQKLKRFLQEFQAEDITKVEVGQEIDLAIFAEGEIIAVTGVSKGRGFMGAMKRYNFHGGRGSHGHRVHRAPGSLGCRTTPGRVFKGKKMPGRMGNENVTVQGLRVVKLIPEHQLLLVKGAIPGPTGGLVTLKKMAK